MGSYNSGDHIASDHIHTDIVTSNIKEPQQKYHIGTIGSRLGVGVGGGAKLVLLGTNPRPLLLQWFKTFGPHKGFKIFQFPNSLQPRQFMPVHFMTLRLIFANCSSRLK